MNRTQAMKRLKAYGTAQNRKVYARHGVPKDMFGVSHANLGKLAREIKTDQGLALELFDTSNHDARVLATMIADPAEMKAKTLDAWARACDHGLSWAVAEVAGKSPSARARAEKWTKAKNEFQASAGWKLVAVLAGGDEVSDAWCTDHLETIEADIHSSKNHVRYSMNTALIALGCRAKLTKAALAAAKRIGVVEVDHGETSCTTPDAASHIAKRVAKKKKARKKPART